MAGINETVGLGEIGPRRDIADEDGARGNIEATGKPMNVRKSFGDARTNIPDTRAD